LKHGADPHLKADDGRSALQFAVRAHRANPEIIALIRQHVEHELPLLDAAEAGDLTAVEAALKRAEDINQKDSAGQTPLFLATYNGHVKVCRLLLEQGAD